MFQSKVMISVLSIVMACFLPSCATGNGENDEDPNLAAKTAIQYATLKVIDEDTERAERVIEIANEVRGLIDTDRSEPTVTLLDPIEDRVREEVNWERLDHADQVVVSNLIDAARAEIEQRIDAQEIDPDNRVAVVNVLGWIAEAARRVTPDETALAVSGGLRPGPVT